MKFLKNMFAFLLPLLAVLITFSIFLLTNNIIKNYKIKISNDYSIVIITNTPLIKDNIESIAGIKVRSIETLDKNKIINNMKNSLSDNAINLLKNRLPYFYQIYLELFPTSSQLEKIKKELLENKNIKKVEIFYKNHNQIYLLLVLLVRITFILFFIIAIFSIIIIAKQIKLWFQEHRIKISILKLHGASTIYSASNVIVYALLSALIASLIASCFIYYVYNNMSVLFPTELKDITTFDMNLTFEILKIILLGFSLTFFTIFGVLLKYKINND